MSTHDHETAAPPPEGPSIVEHPTIPLPPGHVVLPLDALQHTPHDQRIAKAATAILGQRGCTHHGSPAPSPHEGRWYCPSCNAAPPTDAEVHAFAYPEGRPAEHKL